VDRAVPDEADHGGVAVVNRVVPVSLAARWAVGLLVRVS
jgi:hypothetical protein